MSAALIEPLWRLVPDPRSEAAMPLRLGPTTTTEPRGCMFPWRPCGPIAGLAACLIANSCPSTRRVLTDNEVRLASRLLLEAWPRPVDVLPEHRPEIPSGVAAPVIEAEQRLAEITKHITLR